MNSKEEGSVAVTGENPGGVGAQSNGWLNTLQQTIKSLQRLFIDPFNPVQDAVQLKRSQLLAGILLLFVVLQIISLSVLPDKSGTVPYYFYIAIVLNVAAYFLSRSRFFQAGALLWAVVTSMTTFINIYDGSTMGHPEVGFSFLIFSMLVPALVVGPMIVLSIGVFNTLGVAAFQLDLINTNHVAGYSQALIFNITATIIVIGIIYYRDHIEGIRLKEFQQSEENLGSVTMSMRDGLLVNFEGKHVFVNESMARILGYESANELIGGTITNIVHPDVVETIKERHRARLDGKDIDNQYETIFITKSGEPLPVELNVDLTFWKGKQATLVTVRDIRDRKAAEDALKESESLLERAQVIARVGHWKLIPATGEVTGSNELFSIFCLNKDEMTLDAFVEAVHPDDREMDVAAIQRGAEHGESWDIEHRLICKDGSEKWVHAIGEAVKDDADNIVQLIGTVQDITETKHAQLALLDSELWMQNIYNSLDEAVMVVSPDRKLVNANQAAINIFGYSIEEIKSSSTELFHVDHKHYLEFGDRISQAFSEDRTASFEFVVKRKNGEIFPSEHTVSLMKDSSGKAKGIVSVVRDITERKKAEVELKNHRDHLEELIQERTKELHETQDELVRKERLATLGQLTATVSHELRNPLGAMRPSLYIIKKILGENPDTKLVQAINRLDRNVTRCDHIIDELLDFTRITELDLHATRVDDWLESVISEQVIPQGIQLEKDFTLDAIELEIDTDRLRRAVINVFENGCHAMMDEHQQLVVEKDARLHIQTRVNDERIEIVVTDTGSGIPEDVYGKVFEPLFSTKAFGVGLGMPTIKQIMEQHDGGIEIDTEVGKGTTVTLWLPKKSMNELKAEGEE